MKLKDFFSKVSENKSNKQKTVSFKAKKLKEVGMSVDDILDMKITTKILK